MLGRVGRGLTINNGEWGLYRWGIGSWDRGTNMYVVNGKAGNTSGNPVINVMSKGQKLVP